jgi:hypothetical protein
VRAKPQDEKLQQRDSTTINGQYGKMYEEFYKSAFVYRRALAVTMKIIVTAWKVTHQCGAAPYLDCWSTLDSDDRQLPTSHRYGIPSDKGRCTFLFNKNGESDILMYVGDKNFAFSWFPQCDISHLPGH